MKVKIIIALAISMLLLAACNVINNNNTIKGSGNVITESREVSGFNRINISGSGDVLVRQGDTEALQIETDDNIMKYISTRVRNNTLYIDVDTDDGESISPTRLTYTLDLVNLSDVEISGSAKVTAAALDTNDLHVDISGSGRVSIDTLTTDSARINISGSGRVEMAGTAPQMNIDVGGSGTVVTSDLRCNRADIDVSGSGNVTIWATDSLHGEISGSGVVNYYGNPHSEFETTGSGAFKNMGDK